MKNSYIGQIAKLAAAAISVGLLSSALTSIANGAPSSKGAASLLMKSESAVPAATPVKMACAKCTDKAALQKDTSARGANKAEVRVTRHLCKGCDTTIATVGTGKTKKDVATHECTTCGTASLTCCNTKT